MTTIDLKKDKGIYSPRDAQSIITARTKTEQTAKKENDYGLNKPDFIKVNNTPLQPFERISPHALEQPSIIETAKIVESITAPQSFTQTLNPFSSNALISKEELKTSFGTLSKKEAPVPVKVTHSSSNEELKNQSRTSKLNEDSFCCYEAESLSKETFLSYQGSVEKKVLQYTLTQQTKTNDTDSCGSRSHLQTTREGLLKDITNTMFSADESLTKKPYFTSSRENESTMEKAQKYDILQDSEKKNPLLDLNDD